jgi:hypothetical protein
MSSGRMPWSEKSTRGDRPTGGRETSSDDRSRVWKIDDGLGVHAVRNQVGTGQRSTCDDQIFKPAGGDEVGERRCFPGALGGGCGPQKQWWKTHLNPRSGSTRTRPRD